MNAMGRVARMIRNVKVGFLLRAIVSASVLLIVISQIDFHIVLKLFARTDLLYFSLILLLLVADRFLMAYKWNLLTQVKGIGLSLRQSVRIYLISNFLGVFLPDIGKDIYRIYYTSKREGQTEEITASVILERFIGTIATATFTLLGLTLMITMSSQLFFGRSAILTIFGVLVLSLIGFWISMRQITLTRSEYILNRWGNNWFFKKWLQCQRAYVAYRQHKRTLLVFFLLSVLEQSFFTIVNYWGATAMNLNIEFIYFIGIIPVCLILMRLPISINAIGVQEGLYVFFFSRLGVSLSEAFSLALLVRIANLLVILAGGILYLTESSGQKQGLQYPVSQ